MSKSSKNDIRTKLKPLLFHDDWTVVQQGLQLFESLSVSEETFMEAFRSLNRKKIPKRVNYDFLLDIFKDAEYSAYLALTFLGLFAQHRGGFPYSKARYFPRGALTATDIDWPFHTAASAAALWQRAHRSTQ